MEELYCDRWLVCFYVIVNKTGLDTVALTTK